MAKKPENNFDCTKCDRIFHHLHELELHLGYHANFRFVCLVCKMRYSNSIYLSEHQSKTSHKEYQILKKCYKNSSVATTSVPVTKSSNYPKQSRIKQSFKCFKCNYCAYTCGNLKRHLISHQYYLHKCHAIGCKMTFRTLKLLNEHQAETRHSSKNVKEKVNINLKEDTKQFNSSNSTKKDKEKIQSNKNCTEIRPSIKKFRLLIQQIEEQALKEQKKKKINRIECDDRNENNSTQQSQEMNEIECSTDANTSSSSSYFSAFDSEDDENNFALKSPNEKVSLRNNSELLKEEKRRAILQKRSEKYRIEQKASNDLIRIRKFRKKINFQCKKCGKSFGKMGQVRSHVAAHIYANSECPKCKRIVSNRRLLIMHLRAHNRLKFTCSIGSCRMKFASIQCIEKHRALSHGVKSSNFLEESSSENEDCQDKLKSWRITTRSMSQLSELQKYNENNLSPGSSPSSSRSNSPVETANPTSNKFISASLLHQFSIFSLSESESRDLESICTSINVVDIKKASNNSKRVEINKTKDKLELKCLMCPKKFRDSLMMWVHLLNKHK